MGKTWPEVIPIDRTDRFNDTEMVLSVMMHIEQDVAQGAVIGRDSQTSFKEDQPIFEFV